MGISRRECFHNCGFGLLLLPALLRSPRSVLGHLLFEPDGDLVPLKPIPPNPFTRNGRPLVALVHGTDPQHTLPLALSLLGGIERLSLRGKRVLLKPNVLSDRPPPTTTDPLVVGAMARLVREQGPAETIVADGSGIIRLPTSANLTATGMRSAAEAARATVLALEDEPWVRLEPPQAKALTRFYFSKPVYDADILINMPVIKTHRFAEYSCALKNLVGAVHPRQRPSVTFWSGDWHERIAELNLAAHPVLTVADGTTIMIEGGPTSGTSAKANLLVCSGDRVALDMTVLALLRTFGAWSRIEGTRIGEQRQIKRAGELGLGVARGPEIELVAQSVDGAPPDFARLVERIREDLQNS